MASTTNIEWCDSTWNPWIGCTKVSPACDHCYAEVSTPARTMKVVWGPHAERHRTAEGNWNLPRRWNAQHDRFFAKHGRRRRVFSASLADVFDNDVPIEWFVNLLELVRATPNLDWLMLTKRVGTVMRRLRDAAEWIRDNAEDALSVLKSWIDKWLAGEPPANVWLGATIVNQKEADRDIPKLLMTPARLRFLSMEPLLGPVNLKPWFDPVGVCCGQEMQSCEGCPADADWIHGPTTEYAADGRGYTSPRIDWVIVGGESGTKARPMLPEWARALRDQCEAAGVPYLFKQWGEWHTSAVMMSTGHAVFRQFTSYQQWINKAQTWVSGGICIDRNGIQLHNGGDFMRARDSGAFPVTIMHRVGKHAAGRTLDGRTHDAFPEGCR